MTEPRDEVESPRAPDRSPVRRMLRARAPAPRFADSAWVHAFVGAPVGASIAFLLQAPPRTMEHAIVGAMAGALFGVILGAFRPAEEPPPHSADAEDPDLLEPEPEPSEPRTP